MGGGGAKHGQPYQIIVEGRDEDDVRDFANSVDFEKLTYVVGEYELADIA